MTGQSKPAALSPWGSAVAGATGAVLANAIVYPLDMYGAIRDSKSAAGNANGRNSVKTKLQVQEKGRKGSNPRTASEVPHYDSTWDAIVKIADDEGIAGLYSGINGALIGVASTNFAYFYWYSVVRAVYMASNRVPKPPGTAIELTLGAVAGAAAQIFTIPVSVVTTRQQTQPKSEKKGLLDTAREVVDSEDGWSGLWRGLKASLVLVVNPAITYGAYQRLRETLYPGKTNLKPLEAFGKRERWTGKRDFPTPRRKPEGKIDTKGRRIAQLLMLLAVLGALSKTLATMATQPLIVAKVGLQSKPPPSRKGRPFKTFGEVMRYIVQNEGPLGLFKGIGPQILKGLLVQGLLMMTKER
jgi:hypothetical protein